MFPLLSPRSKPVNINDQKAGIFNPISKVSLSEPSHPSMPVIPPVTVHNAPSVPSLETDDKLEWFVVLSPRETKGVSGPLSVFDLKQLYKYGEIHDTSLVWREGHKTWQRISEINYIRYKMISMPLVPSKTISFPVLPPRSKIPNFKRFCCDSMTRHCSVCGNVAIGHTPDKGEQVPVYALTTVGSTSVASEVIPGFLWIGNAASAKKNPLNQLAITLAINCTDTLKSPSSRPPFYRHKVAPMIEKPHGKAVEREEELLVLFEHCYDWIEQERVCPDRVALSDEKKPEYRGPTDKFGRPLIKDKDLEPPAQRPEFEGSPPPRVLVWSKLGFDRACVVAASYIMKYWGLSVASVVKLLESTRPGTKISGAYVHALKKWSKKYTLGTLYCEDCLTSSILKEKPYTTDGELISGTLETVQAAVNEVSELSKLGEVDQWLTPVATIAQVGESLMALCDLQLSSTRLGSSLIIQLFQCLSTLSLATQLRSLVLKDNLLSCEGITAIVEAISPTDSEVPSELCFLDLSHNM